MKVLVNRLIIDKIIKITVFYKFNVNEIEIIKEIKKNVFVFSKAIRVKILVKNTYNRKWIFIIIYINANGRTLFLLIIFNGKSI